MKLKFIVAAAAALGSTTASAATLSELASGVTASGWISGGYVYTPIDGQPGVSETAPNGVAVYHANDITSDTFTLNQAALNLTSAPETGFGGGVSLLLGDDAATIVNPSYGDGSDKFSLQQAYLTYAAGALTVTAGRYNSLAGYEVVADPLNSTLTRSLLFPNAEPYFHTGVRAAYKASDAATFYLGVNNSAQLGAAVDNNQQKTIELGGAFTLSPAITLGIYDYYGVEGGFGNAKTNYLDFVLSFTATDALSFALSGDYVTVEDVQDTLGFAGYATYKFSPLLSATLRLETITFSPEGAEDLTVNEATVALKYTPASNFIFLAEARVDDADADIYVKDNQTGELTGTQPLFSVKGIVTFGL